MPDNASTPVALPWLAPPSPHNIHNPQTLANQPSPPGIFPNVNTAWDAFTPAPGLLAAGADLQVATLVQAYQEGIFPWYSEGQPILWWSPNPRMVLATAHYRLHPSMRKTLLRFRRNLECEIRIDTAFHAVISACAQTPRRGQAGTWIQPEMVNAYLELHQAGYAHSVETWMEGNLVAGLYCVAIGKAVFGESMFTRVTDASKIALAALVAYCKHHGVQHIDCQQNTAHLASLGAREIPRTQFVEQVKRAAQAPATDWQFTPLYWENLIPH